MMDKDIFNQLFMLLKQNGTYKDFITIYSLNKNSIHCRTSEGDTLLHYAVFRNDTKIVKFLLKEGMSINLLDYENMSPIMVAIQCGHYSLASTLLRNKPDLSLLNNNGQNALILLAINKPIDHSIITIVIDNSDINKQDNNNMTALMHAAKRNNCILIEYLIIFNANLMITDNYGNTAYTFLKNNPKVIKYKKTLNRLHNLMLPDVLLSLSSEKLNNEHGIPFPTAGGHHQIYKWISDYALFE